MPLGETLLNPFNLEKNKNFNWLGQIEGGNKTFCQFTTIEFGLRAGILNLKNQLREGFNTIDKLITKYAPPSENNTAAYKYAISKALGKNYTDVLTDNDIKALAVAIIIHEQGRCIYADNQIKSGLIAAGVDTYDKAIIAKPTIMQRLYSVFLSRKA